MQKKIQTLILLLLLFCGFKSQAQTTISGGIFVNQTWTIAGSPYLITDTTTLFPGFTLTIQPGTVLKFSANVVLNIRGTLNVLGTMADSVYFIPADSISNQPQSWVGVVIDNTQGATATVQYAVFNHAVKALENVCCFGGGPFSVANSSFKHNFLGIAGYSGIAATVTRCYFGYNYAAINQADKIVDYCFFEYNTYGLWATERISVTNSIFCSNTTALYGGRGDLQNNTIIYNGTGVYGFFEGFTNVNNNIISRNDTGIVITGNGLGSNNIICENVDFNAINTQNYNISIANNCWCTTNPIALGNLIHDAYDDVNLGLLQYTPLVVCDTSILSGVLCDLSILTSSDEPVLINDDIVVFPNPASDAITVESSGMRITALELYDMSGRLLLLEKTSTNRNTISLENLAAGVYLLRITTEEGIISRKIIRE
ncbi:MAG: T9SS type A sorting domain-containing protein [Bacteroidia bacterium]